MLTIIQSQLDDLAERTGIYALVFVTRGHVDDTAPPTWFGSGDSMDFIRDVLELDPWDVTRQFEQWACARQKCELKQSDHFTMCSQEGKRDMIVVL
jgi:hypothetical protein